MNVFSKAGVSRMKLNPEPQPQQVAWVDKTYLPVFERCIVPIQMGDYTDQV